MMNATFVIGGCSLFVAVVGLILSRTVTRRVRVTLHLGFADHGSFPRPPYYFINVTNISLTREIEVTSVWFEVGQFPKVYVLPGERPLPKRLKVDESWETWKSITELPTGYTNDEMYKTGRVQISTGKMFRSKQNKLVPSVGYVPGADPPPALSGTYYQPNLAPSKPRPHFAFTRLGYKPLLINNDPRQGVIEATTEEAKDEGVMGITLSFTNLSSGGGSKLAMNVVARIRFYSENWSTRRDIPYGVWLNSPCNVTAIAIGAVEELLLVVVNGAAYGAVRDLRVAGRKLDSGYVAVEDVPWFRYVRVKLIDQSSDTSEVFALRVWKDNGWCHAPAVVPKNIEDSPW
jgi:hypothetical protein